MWDLNLDGTHFSYNAQSGDTLASVAAGIAARITSNSLLTAGGKKLFTANATGSKLTVKRIDGTNFTTVATTVTPATGTTPPGTAVITGAQYSASVNAANLTVTPNAGNTDPFVAKLTQTHFSDDIHTIDITPQGTVNAGDTWTVTLDGTDFSFTASTGQTLTDVSNALKSLIDARGSFTVTLDNVTNKLTIARTAAEFDASFTQKNGSLSATASTTHWAVANITLNTSANAINSGDRWTMTLMPANAATATYLYTAGSNKEASIPANVDVQITDDDAPTAIITQTGGSTHVTEPTSSVLLGTGFVLQVRPAIKITATAATLITTSITGSTTSHISIKTIAGKGTPDAFTEILVIFSGDVGPLGTVWTITLTGTAFSHTVIGGDTCRPSPMISAARLTPTPHTPRSPIPPSGSKATSAPQPSTKPPIVTIPSSPPRTSSLASGTPTTIPTSPTTPPSRTSPSSPPATVKPTSTSSSSPRT